MDDKIILDNDEDVLVEKVVERKREKNGVNIIEKIKNQTLDQTKLLGYIGLGIGVLIIFVMLFLYPSSFVFYGNAYGRSFLVMLPYLLIACAGLVCSSICGKRKESFIFKLGFIVSISAVALCIFIPIWCLII